MAPPIVSVIIPVYNAEKWIRETVESVRRQTYPSVELILIDDGSSDQTRSLLSELDPSVRVLLNPTNVGVAGARNRGIQAAHGTFIALLDHDDLWEPNKLTLQMALFEKNPLLGLVFSDCLYRPEQGKSWRSFINNPPTRGQALDALLSNNFIPCLTAVMPKTVLEKVGFFRNDFRMSEDYELFLRIAQRYPIDYVDAPLAIYRIHDQNFSRRLDVYYSEWIKTVEIYSKISPRHGVVALAKMQLGLVYMRQGILGRGLRSFVLGFLEACAHVSDFIETLKFSWSQKKNAQTR